MELNFVFHGILYLSTIDETGALTIVAKGQPIAVPENIYASAVNFKPAFDCKRCGARVRTVSLAEHGQGQVCRCQRVLHSQPEYGYGSAEQWEAFALCFEEESRHPAPDNGDVLDPISGAPIGATNEAQNFIARKLGFKGPIEITQNGALLKTSAGGSVYHDATTLSVDSQDEAETEDLMHAFALRVGPDSPPPAIIIAGDDLDYTWPPGTYDIRPLPFRCSNCGARVRLGRLDLAADRVADCLCLSVFFRRDTPSPRSSGEWKAYHDTFLRGRVKHRAADADGNS
jgi:hypothetical protein